ncbi:hypothetical protein GOP47_0026873 [Adiantum capillus-veneris]|nr:hypothetical protein GOP47_0026873 [Adiantum capillus-veneris]
MAGGVEAEGDEKGGGEAGRSTQSMSRRMLFLIKWLAKSASQAFAEVATCYLSKSMLCRLSVFDSHLFISFYEVVQRRHLICTGGRVENGWSRMHTAQMEAGNLPSPALAGTLVLTAVLGLQLASPLLLRSARTYLMRPRKCRICLGVGNNLCTFCKGRGKQGGLFTGEPLEKCGLCGGRGRQLCGKCNATGLANSWLYKPLNNGGWGPMGD